MKKRITLITITLLLWAGCAWADITTGLVGFWPLTNQWMQNSVTVSDLGSGDNPGTLVNSPVVGSDGTTFDGVDQYITMEGTAMDGTNPLDLNDSFSISFWLYPTASSSSYVINNYEGTGSYSGNSINIDTDPNNGGIDINLHIDDDVNPTDVVTSKLELNQWHHVVAVRDKGNKAYMYVDGSENNSENDVTTGDISSNRDWNFGKKSEASQEFFNGQLSDVRIYNRALTSDDVAELYALGQNSMAPQAPTGTAGYHATGLTATDNRSSFTDSYAWCTWDGIDLSDYSTSGKWFIRLYDSSGNVAEGYSGGAGSGETLGSNVLDALDLILFTKINCTALSTSFTLTSTSGYLSKSSFLVPYALWKCSFSASNSISGDTEMNGYFVPLMAVANSGDRYSVPLGTWIQFRTLNSAIGNITTISSAIAQQVTSPPTTAIMILDGPSGSAGWAKIDSAFDYNDIVEIEIVPVATFQGVTLTGVSTQ